MMAMTDDQRCATCRWWQHDADVHEFGTCGLLPPSKDRDAPLLAFCTEGGSIFTSPDFGCVQWKAKP